MLRVAGQAASERINYEPSLILSHTVVERKANVPSADFVGDWKLAVNQLLEYRLFVKREFIHFTGQADASVFHSLLERGPIHPFWQKDYALVPARARCGQHAGHARDIIHPLDVTLRDLLTPLDELIKPFELSQADDGVQLAHSPV